MSEVRKVKKIELETLESNKRQAWTATLKRLVLAVVIVGVLSGGGYAAYRMLTGSVVGSRFAVNSMNCPACVITLKEVTGKLPGVVETEVSLAAQDVTVKFRDKQVNPEAIREAMTKAGYPARLDGMFAGLGEGIGDTVIAEVNGKPLFKKDLEVQMEAGKQNQSNLDKASALFSLVGMRILLQAADTENVVVQPYEIEAEIQRIATEKGAPQDKYVDEMASKYGSREKYFQVVAQRLGIQRLIDDHVAVGTQDADEKKRKVLDWAGRLFRQSNVIVVDREVRETLHASSGNDEWKSFWPRMIASDSDLKSLLLR